MDEAMDASTSVRRAEHADAVGFGVYLERHLAESGTGGDPVYAMDGSDEPFDQGAFVAAVREAWTAPVGGHPWRRSWLAFDAGVVVGHGDLRGAPMPGERHRAEVGLGVLRSHRRRGFGHALMGRLVRWSEESPEVAWLDLGVFVPNRPAVELYERLGFERTGFVRDRFRVGGRQLDEMTMTLDVRGDAT